MLSCLPFLTVIQANSRTSLWLSAGYSRNGLYIFHCSLSCSSDRPAVFPSKRRPVGSRASGSRISLAFLDTPQGLIEDRASVNPGSVTIYWFCKYCAWYGVGNPGGNGAAMIGGRIARCTKCLKIRHSDCLHSLHRWISCAAGAPGDGCRSRFWRNQYTLSIRLFKYRPSLWLSPTGWHGARR